MNTSQFTSVKQYIFHTCHHWEEGETSGKLERLGVLKDVSKISPDDSVSHFGSSDQCATKVIKHLLGTC